MLSTDMTGKMEFHEYAEFFPLMEGEEFEQLVEDVRENGLLEPIVRFGGKILDGRNRYRACLEAGVQPQFEDYAGDSPIHYVVSMNLKRRHLDEFQRSDIVTEMKESLQGSTEPGGWDATAARLASVSEATIKRVDRVKREAPDLLPKLRSKELSPFAAEEIVRARIASRDKGVEEEVQKAIEEGIRPEKVRRVAESLSDPELIREALRRAAQTEEAAEEVFEDNLEIAEDIEAGRLMGEGIKVHIDPDIKRLQRFEELRDRITGLRGFDFDMIEDAELRQQAVECIRQIRDFCEALLAQLAERR